MNDTQHMDHELWKELCYFYWDIVNSPELRALSPSTIHPTSIQYSSLVLSILTCIIGFVINVIAILVTGFLMKENKCKIGFLNLAVADFTFLLFLPLYAESVIRGQWRHGSSACKFYNFLKVVTMYTGIYIFTALNIDRALSVAKPMWYLRFRSLRLYWYGCAVIWISSTICSLPAIIYSHVHNISEPQCLLFPSDLVGIVNLHNYQNFSTSEGWRSSQRGFCDESFQSIEQFQEWIEILSTTMGLLAVEAAIAFGIPLCLILFSNIVVAYQVKNSKTATLFKLHRMMIVAGLVFFCTKTPLVLGQIIVLVAFYTMKFTLMYKVILFFPLLSSIAATNTFLVPAVYILLGNQASKAISRFLRKLCSRSMLRGLYPRY